METLSIEGTPKTPTIVLDFDKGTLLLKGRSIPENSVEFYAPLLDSLDKYMANPQPTTAVDIHLEYFNTSTSKCILDIFKKLENIHKSGNSQVLVNWHYEEEDEEMLVVGEEYQTIVKVPFKMVLVDEEA
jgi:hypothetical protein